MSPELRDRLSAIYRRSYEHHGGTGAWGVRADDETACSYAAGCAIGISLSPEVAAIADVMSYDAASLLGRSTAARLELFGGVGSLPLEAVSATDDLQELHDNYARLARLEGDGATLRADYRDALTDLATYYGLTLEAPNVA